MEKRQKHVREDELCNWEGVTQELMSDEEEFEDGFKVKTQIWRSESFNQLIKNLEQQSGTLFSLIEYLLLYLNHIKQSVFN